MRRISLMALLFMLLGSNAYALVCSRIQYSATGFSTTKAAESWFPETIPINDNRFKVSSSNPNQMIYRRQVAGKVRITQLFILLPNGNLTSLFPKISEYRSTGNTRYKCNKTSLEMKQQIGLE